MLIFWDDMNLTVRQVVEKAIFCGIELIAETGKYGGKTSIFGLQQSPMAKKMVI